MKQLLYILFSGIFLISCYKEVDLNKYHTTPKMVINCTISPDTVVMASITRTWFYPENMPYVNLPHAKVELYINDRYIEQMQWKTLFNPEKPELPDTFFISNSTPKEGDKIKIIASTPEYGIATAEDIIPKKVPIENVQYTIRKGEGIYEENYTDYYEIFYTVRFKELPEEGNYYLAKIIRSYQYGDEDYLAEANIDYIDPIFKEQNAILDGSMGFNGLNNGNGALFTDQSINGQTYTLQLKEIATKLNETEPRIIFIYSLSESYFLYLLSLQKIAGSTLEGGLGNIGFAEPLRIYSNVKGGTGILGSSHHSDFTIVIN